MKTAQEIAYEICFKYRTEEENPFIVAEACILVAKNIRLGAEDAVKYFLKAIDEKEKPLGKG